MPNTDGYIEVKVQAITGPNVIGKAPYKNGAEKSVLQSKVGYFDNSNNKILEMDYITKYGRVV